MNYQTQMKIVFTLLFIAIVTTTGSLSWYLNYDPESRIPASNCKDPDSISSHVYGPSRLQIVRACLTVSGTVAEGSIDPNPDGDTHVGLRVDPQYQYLINDGDKQYQSGTLVLEIVCAHSVAPLQPVIACQNYNNTIPIPAPHQHITVTGPYVLDTNHYDWAEIHPVYTLTFS